MAEAQPGQVEQSSVRAPIFTFRDQVRDFARPNLFQVEIYAPPVLQDSVGPQSGAVAGSVAERSENSLEAIICTYRYLTNHMSRKCSFVDNCTDCLKILNIQEGNKFRFIL